MDVVVGKGAHGVSSDNRFWNGWPERSADDVQVKSPPGGSATAARGTSATMLIDLRAMAG